MKVFHKTTTCPRQQLLGGPKRWSSGLTVCQNVEELMYQDQYRTTDENLLRS